MPEHDIEAIACKIVEKLKQDHHALWLDPESHAEQHEFIRLLMDERAERLRRRKAMEDKIAGSLVLAFILGTVGLIGSGTLDWLRTHLK